MKKSLQSLPKSAKNWSDQKKTYLIIVGLFWGLAALISLSVYLFVLGDIQGSPNYTLGVFFMFASMALLIMVLREKWRGSLATVFIGMLILYHGISEFFYVFFPVDIPIRIMWGISETAVATAVLMSGVSMFIYVVGCILVYSIRGLTSRTDIHKSKSSDVIEESIQKPALASWILSIDPRILLLWFLFIAFYRSGGRNYFLSNSFVLYWADLVGRYLAVPVFVLSALYLFFLWRSGKLRSYIFVTTIIIGIGLMAFLGDERQEIMIFAVVLTVLLFRWNIYHFSLRDIIIGLVILFFAFSMVAHVRSQVGRAALQSSTPMEKVTIFSEAVHDMLLRRDSANKTVIDEGARRLDANFYTAAIIENVSPVKAFDARPYQISMIAIVPSSLWPDKLSLPVYYRNVEGYIKFHYGLPPIDSMATPIVVFYASGGLPGLLIGMFFTGLFTGYLDRTLWYPRSLWGGVFIICAAIGLAWVERSISIWFVFARSALIFALFLTVFTRIKNHKSAIKA